MVRGLVPVRPQLYDLSFLRLISFYVVVRLFVCRIALPMDVVFVNLQFLFGTKGLFANVAGILIFRILIHFQTSARDASVTISDLHLSNEMWKRGRMFVAFFGCCTEKKLAKQGLSQAAEICPPKLRCGLE